MSGLGMDEYQRGYLDGYRDAVADRDDPAHEMRIGEQEGERLLLAESMGQPPPDPEAESGYWLGYYHGRSHGHTGTPPAGAAGQVPAGL